MIRPRQRGGSVASQSRSKAAHGVMPPGEVSGASARAAGLAARRGQQDAPVGGGARFVLFSANRRARTGPELAVALLGRISSPA
jgi:hypothetical protein